MNQIRKHNCKCSNDSAGAFGFNGFKLSHFVVVQVQSDFIWETENKTKKLKKKVDWLTIKVDWQWKLINE